MFFFIYSVRMRQFRLTFIEIICRTTNIAEAKEIERRVFGSPNAVGVAFEEGPGHGGDQQNAEQPNVNNNNNEALPLYENHIEQLNS